ncbi:ATP-binding protein [Sphingomonas xinjiangensis]|uniref:Putative ATPase/DNA-binding winged helix-turn-helix (WHTH) protein n=1 Tax=Sphingomonas xinjiangensis TaxID=643568 RepID=A0A840YAD6_9SPHN|nr:winged helix-turn-helix domain-containing protein [Sphingomonas xinjiangensis]MBB5709814.1 putative ATPase/DNA-binding winged helix-turn-helix (wHTH) protein [Sphingomonas xinjiangensis]
MPSTCYAFGPFILETPQLRLTREGKPVKLGARALNLLAVLAEAQGALVPRETLIARVWPNQAIDETALRVHLSGARKAMGQVGGSPIIVAEPGRGYRLGIAVTVEADDPAPAAATATRARLPGRVGKVFGRDAVIAALADELVEHRFISLVGPGGIGKTTASLAIAQRVAERGQLDAWFVDLAPVGDGALLPSTIATKLGIPASGADLLARIAAHLAERAAMILLDNCEHVVEAAAVVAEALLQGAPGLLLLTTSREPLRAEGEWVHRLAALEFPGDADRASVEAVARCPATALFAERASAVNKGFALDADNAPAIIDICRQLEGIPLAIELAAARSDTMTPQAIAAGLDDRFALLTRGRRTALPRHRTLRGALDWSYDLLDTAMRVLLDRLSLYRGDFDAERARAMAEGAGIAPAAAEDILAELVAKSMIVATVTSAGVRYRLLDTTRHYGLERLAAAGTIQAARRDHAHIIFGGLGDSAAAWEGKAPREWLAEYSAQIDDVRSAISWASGADGGALLTAELVIAAAPLWFHLSLPGEFLQHAEAAIALMEAGGVELSRQVELLSAYGHGLWHTQGPVPAMAEAFSRALALAEVMESPPLALRALWGVWAQRILDGHYAESLTLAARFGATVGADGALGDRQTAAHMLALSHHFSGDHDQAMAMLEIVMAGDAAPERANHANHAQVDGKIAVMSLLMRLHWMRGDLEGALAIANACAEDAARIDHALSVCYGLAVGCIPVAIAAGEPMLAATWIDALAERTERHGLDHWGAFVPGYSRALGKEAPLPGWISGMQAEMFAVALNPQAPVPWRPNDA